MDPRTAETRERLGCLVSRSDENLDLAEAALLIAREEYPGLEIESYLHRLDAMAERLRERLKPGAHPRETAGALNAYLFDEAGFAGNTQEYYDPRNSFLNEVLDRRLGIPITLATVYMEIARRIGLRVEGIGLPGHFTLRHPGEGAPFYIDPFNRGAFLSAEECRLRVAEVFAGAVRFRPDFLEPVTKRQILIRMLHNLKGIYIQRGDYARALGATDRILILDPSSNCELRDRGLLYFRLECFGNALRDLEAYLDQAPRSEDACQVRGHVQALRTLVRMIN
jgi:regulator of sirC expression with transglutaminase-like and TPR domain